MKKARIENGVVAEILDADPFPPFHPSLVWVECGDVAVGDLYQNGEFSKPPVDLAAIRSAMIKKIDHDADAIYQAVMGSRATEYAQAEADATAYKASGYSGQVPAYVQAWAGATNKTAQWAADDILATAASWRTAQAAIRQNRLASKEAVRKAATVEEVNTAMATWVSFVAYIKGQLGV